MSEWYADGLRFECTRCGNCCTGPQGHVWMSPRDQESVAHFLGLSHDRFGKRYLRLVGNLMSLVDKPNGDCIFLTEGKRCSIQPVKPRQCLTFPFWPRVTASKQSWEEMAQSCPGMGQGGLYKPEEVEAIQSRETPRGLVCTLTNKKQS